MYLRVCYLLNVHHFSSLFFFSFFRLAEFSPVIERVESDKMNSHKKNEPNAMHNVSYIVHILNDYVNLQLRYRSILTKLITKNARYSKIIIAFIF